MLSRTIENAQKKVEQQNFLIRKRVLEYDDVLNQQREVIYKYRREILEGRDMSEPAKEELRGVFERIVQEYTPGDFVEDWDVDGLFAQVRQIFEPSFGPTRTSRPRRSTATSWPTGCTRTRCGAYARARGGARRGADAQARARRAAADHRRRAGASTCYDMDYLREGIHLRGFAQKDPLVEYKNEGFALFRDLMNSIWEDFGRYIFHVEVEIEPAAGRMALARSSQPGARRASATPAAGRSSPRRSTTPPSRPASRSPSRTAAGVRRAARGRDAPRRRARQDRPQRPVLVRLGQEVQEVPRRVARWPSSSSTESAQPRVAKLRDQLKLLADYL